MLNIQAKKQRFSLYNLDEGEMFIKDYFATMTYYIPSKNSFDSLSGRIYLGSRSIIFEPDDTTYSLSKFHFKEMTSLPFWIPNEIPSKSSLNFHIKRIVEIPIGDFTVPYSIHSIPEDQMKNKTEIVISFEKIEIVAKIINECIEKFNSKESCFEFDSVEYMGSIYSFKFDITKIKSINEELQINKELYVKQWLPLIEVPGWFMVTNSRLYFQPLFKVNTKKNFSVKLNTITELYKRKVRLYSLGIEVITPKKNLLLEFETEGIRDSVLNIISQFIIKEKCETNVNIDKYTKLWVDGSLSNYDYWVKLNSAANRTRNDLSQYPVFPWVISNYSTATLDLNDPSIYRDLGKPIGAINQKRWNEYLVRYKEMPEPKFIYGTHYSTSAYTIGYLARKYPEYMLKLHGGKFDNPDRVFSSILLDWEICWINPGSLKELIPEFYESNTDFLVNNLKIDLGINSKGVALNNVELPVWAESPEMFLKMNRDAWESEYVSKNLHKWIDLIFGYQQRGEEAVKANNLFHPVSYADSKNFNGKDIQEIKIIQIEATEFGQCPNQLFYKPHPQKFNKETNEIVFDINIDKINWIDVSKISSNILDDTGAHSNIVGNTIKYPFESIHFESLPKHHKKQISASTYMSETSTLLSGGYDGSVKIFECSTKKIKRLLQLSDFPITSISKINDSSLAIVGSADNKAYIINTALGRATTQWEAHEDSIISWFYSEKHNILITDGADSTYKVWSISSNSSRNWPWHIYYDTDNRIITCDFRDEDCAHVCLDEDGNLIYRNITTDNFNNDMIKICVEDKLYNYVKLNKVNTNEIFIGGHSNFDVYDIRKPNTKVQTILGWDRIIGVDNDSSRGLVCKNDKIFISEFGSEDYLKEFNIGTGVCHFNSEFTRDKGVVLAGNVNGDLFYSI